MLMLLNAVEMVVIMVYHELISRESQHVSSVWKITILVLLSLNVICAIIGSYSIRVLYMYYGECFVDTELVFNRTSIGNQSDGDFHIYVDSQQSKWGVEQDCLFIRFTPIMLAVCASMWMVLFAMCGNGGRGRNFMFSEPWHIVLPAILFVTAMICVSWTHSSQLYGELRSFCQQLRNGLQTNGQTIDTETGAMCPNRFEQFSTNKLLAELTAATYYNMSVYTTFVIAVLWCAVMVVLVLRVLMMADFQLIRVQVITIQREPDKQAKWTSGVVS